MSVWDQVVRQLGDLPIGSPGEVRARAVLIQECSEALEAQARRLRHRVAGLSFEGPAAKRFRADIYQLIGQLQEERNRLAELAAWLRSEAGELQARQDDWRWRASRLYDELRERAREVTGP